MGAKKIFSVSVTRDGKKVRVTLWFRRIKASRAVRFMTAIAIFIRWWFDGRHG